MIIKAKCSQCSTTYLLFDNDYHGWNGHVCGGDNRHSERPQTKSWNCDACSNKQHKLVVEISSQGKEDFIQESEGDFPEEEWTEGFEWIVIKTECQKCKKKNPQWISYETM